MNLAPVDFEEVLAPDFMQLLAGSIIGTSDAREIEDLSRLIATRYLGLREPICFLFEVSVGAVFAFAEADGKRVLAKIQAPGTTLEETNRRIAFQRYLHANDFPFPAALMDPVQIDNLVLIAEAYLETGKPADGHDPHDRRLMAEGLYHIVELSRGFDGLGDFPVNTLAHAEGDLWPTPHNVLFDFSRPVHDAGWIDELATHHWQRLEETESQQVIGHMDWSAKHCRVQDDRLVAVHDWDSTARLPEVRVLGGALASFTYTETPGALTRPDESELIGFLRDYERARGSRFADNDIDEIASAILYSIAYGARCEAANDYGNPDARRQARTCLSELSSINLAERLLDR